jgi:hypothetical protein
VAAWCGRLPGSGSMAGAAELALAAGGGPVCVHTPSQMVPRASLHNAAVVLLPAVAGCTYVNPLGDVLRGWDGVIRMCCGAAACRAV